MGEKHVRSRSNLGGRGYAQQIVITRLLYCLHDPAAQPSRMQGIYPRAW